MESNRQKLMKHFATILRNLALGKQTENLMSKNLAFYFTRKQLIEMVTKYFKGTIPKEYNLMELENKELLNLIENELFIISYVTEEWSSEASLVQGEPVQVTKKKKTGTNSQKPKLKPNEKENDKTA